MLFNSYSFLLFFPAVCFIYFIFPKKYQYVWLLVASYYFYMCWNAKYVLLLLFSTVITWCCGLVVEKFRRYRKLALAANFIFTLSILFLFKYFDFVVNNINRVLDLFSLHNLTPGFSLLLPVGISFYTFQALGYSVDVYRGEIPAEKNFLKYALFVSFFPQLVAGPIERSKSLLSQVGEKHTFSYERMRDGLLIMLWGYFLKIVIADRAAIYIDTVYGDLSTYGGCYIIIANLLFAVQVYCDFAGYSTIAVGAAKVMGFRLMENFNAPYLSGSIAEFWRNWHISLTSWFRDYLYIPLGGSRKGKLRKYINTMIVFLSSGLWHGANWNYIVWGGINGLYIIVGEILAPIRDWMIRLLKLNKNSVGHKILSVTITFILFDISLVFFRASGGTQAIQAFKSMVMVHNSQILFNGALYTAGLSYKNFCILIFAVLILAVTDFLNRRGIKISKVIVSQDLWFRWLVYLVSIMFILIFGIWGPAYEASNFIYFQF